MTSSTSTCSLYSEKTEDGLSGSEDTEELNWVEWFCGQPGREPFVEVDEDYISDDFNLTGLQSFVPQYRRALDLILDIGNTDADDLQSDEQQSEIETAAQVLYGLIHARFLLTNRGMQLIQEKYKQAAYGHCPSTYCASEKVFPLGISDHPSYHKCKVYCPKCNEVYHPEICQLAEIDGAYFGTSAALLFFMRNRDAVPVPRQVNANPPDYYHPTVCGFRVNRDVKDRLREMQNCSVVPGSRHPNSRAQAVAMILSSSSMPSAPVRGATTQQNESPPPSASSQTHQVSPSIFATPFAVAQAAVNSVTASLRSNIQNDAPPTHH